MITPWSRRPVIYRCFDKDSRLIYIGSSINVEARFAAHARDSFWWRNVARVRFQCASNELDARRREAVAIREENPRFNLNHRRPREQWTEQDYRDVISTLRRRRTASSRRVRVLKREMAARSEGLA